jgi:lantibiotic modifying enzyme
LFDDDAQNWPDLRTSSHQLRSEDTARFVVTWCNGAAGIALSRLHAMAADPEFRMDYGRQARIGLIATQRQLNDLLAAGTNMSLCHGIAGLVETLWVGSSGTLAATALHSWLERWGTDDNAYGDFVLSNPGLMVGAAGIGHQCLRMYDPGGVRSILAGPWRAGHSISPRTRQVV